MQVVATKPTENRRQIRGIRNPVFKNDTKVRVTGVDDFGMPTFKETRTVRVLPSK
jgi:hypothetical protein